jgi:hypothetical protein
MPKLASRMRVPAPARRPILEGDKKMSRRTTTESRGGGRKGYTIGYGRPPTRSRFQKGQSGNPAGRRKGVQNLGTDVKRTLATPVRVKENGRTRNKSTQESALMVLREKALRGDARALDLLLELAARFNNDPAEAGQAQPLPADDQAILAAYVAECMAETRPAAAKSAADQSPKLGGDSSKKSPK